MFIGQYKNIKFIFIHIPKTAGTSITYMFRKEIKSIKQYSPIKPKHPKLISLAHKIQDSLDNYYSFTIVRNPWDRMVSAFHYHQNFILQCNPNNIFHNFNDYIKCIINNCRVKDIHFFRIKQIEYIRNKNGLCIINEVFRFEEGMDKIWKIILSRLHVDKFYPLVKKIKKPRPHYRKYYNNHTREMVAKYFEEDIDYFKYTF